MSTYYENTLHAPTNAHMSFTYTEMKRQELTYIFCVSFQSRLLPPTLHITSYLVIADVLYTASVIIIVVGHSTHRYGGRFIHHSYGAVSGQIWLDDVHCNGTETNLAQCRHNGWGIHDCAHDKDVSVSCNTGIITLLSAVQNVV